MAVSVTGVSKLKHIETARLSQFETENRNLKESIEELGALLDPACSVTSSSSIDRA